MDYELCSGWYVFGLKTASRLHRGDEQHPEIVTFNKLTISSSLSHYKCSLFFTWLWSSVFGRCSIHSVINEKTKGPTYLPLSNLWKTKCVHYGMTFGNHTVIQVTVRLICLLSSTEGIVRIISIWLAHLNAKKCPQKTRS